MKTTDFLKEDIGEDANNMHKDHEVQMARQDCYNAAKDAIALHKLLKNISEMQGLDGWVSEKITLAADYLKTVHDYLEYELMSKTKEIPSFDLESAEQTFDTMLGEESSEDVASSTTLSHNARQGTVKQLNDGSFVAINPSGNKKQFNSRSAAEDWVKGSDTQRWVKENASAGATSAGAVAAVVKPAKKKMIKRK